MRRRHTLGLILSFGATSLFAQSPLSRVYRLAWLSGGAIIPSEVWTEFVTAMKALGWIEDRDFTVENLRYGGSTDRLPALAADAVQRKFDLIICAGTPPAVAARDATATIPIVFYFVGDPVGTGLIASLARPGGNVTGLGGLGQGVYGKMLELLIEAVPAAKRIAMITNSAFPAHATFRADAESAARKLNVTLASVELRAPEEVDGAFAAIARENSQALLILGQPFLVALGPRLARLAIDRRLPTIAPFEGVVADGILMSYGGRLIDDVRRLPYYVDRILKGAGPATLPVEQPSRFYLAINLKTAKAIDMTMPPSLLARADRVID